MGLGDADAVWSIPLDVMGMSNIELTIFTNKCLYNLRGAGPMIFHTPNTSPIHLHPSI